MYQGTFQKMYIETRRFKNFFQKRFINNVLEVQIGSKMINNDFGPLLHPLQKFRNHRLN